MDGQYFENLSDTQLEQAAGGVSISLTLDKHGASLSGPLGELSIANPFRLIGKAVSGVLGAAGNLLGRLGGALTDAGHLFDFG